MDFFGLKRMAGRLPGFPAAADAPAGLVRLVGGRLNDGW